MAGNHNFCKSLYGRIKKEFDRWYPGWEVSGVGSKLGATRYYIIEFTKGNSIPKERMEPIQCTADCIHAAKVQGMYAKLEDINCGCDHEWRELGRAECKDRGINHRGRCYHVYMCQGCGEVEAHDSSD
jgi:hypothetical protein